MPMKLLRWTMDLILRQPILFWTAFIINVVGVVWGIFLWYWPMLISSPLWTIPFIPDCPEAALFWCIAAIGLWMGKRWPAFTAFTAFACIKYGFWTLFFWSRHWMGGAPVEFMEVVLFLSHIGLICEGILLLPYIGSISLGKRLAIIAWFVFSIFVDYGLGYHPPMTAYVTSQYASWVAVILTTLLGVGLLCWPYQQLARPSAAGVRAADA